ncbi:MAG: helix-turn-helix transcriptional regulator [Desulfovibrio aminophilus]|uniref:AraC family transcriptional regulator n=1 Tax=Desulfovibrio aminophilus TaxID=81425 RepID=UPI002A46690A|nr:helix-turn-helix transcriptional regulator [Desulfovibrionaceae bacterium]
MTKNSAKQTTPSSHPGNNTDQFRPIIGFSRQGLGMANVPHSHFRAQLVHAASGVMTITTSMGIWVTPPHQGLWVPSGVEHHVRVYGPYTLKTLFFHPDAAPWMPPECRVVPVSPLLRELVIHACGFPPDYPADGPEARVVAVILDLMRTATVEPLHLPMPHDPRLAVVCRRLLENPADRSTLPELAERAGAADRTLLRLFHKETGLTFRVWRRQARLLAALRKLAAGEPVSSVAPDLGYESQSAFIAMFRRALGTTPGRYFSETEAARASACPDS